MAIPEMIVVSSGPDDLSGVDPQGSQPADRLLADFVVELLLATAMSHVAAVAGTGTVERTTQLRLDGLQVLPPCEMNGAVEIAPVVAGGSGQMVEQAGQDFHRSGHQIFVGDEADKARMPCGHCLEGNE